MCHYSYPVLYIYIPDMSTNVTHFTKLVNKMIQAMDTPEASTVSLWEKLTSSPWWKTILITRNLMVLFLLENPRDGGAWWAAVYGIAQSQTRLK